MSTTPPAGQPQPSAGGPQKRLYRSRDQRMIGGVCGGLAEYLGMDPTVVRLLTVVLGVVSVGTALIAYIVAMIVVPEAPAA
jgi:phage shock protein C